MDNDLEETVRKAKTEVFLEIIKAVREIELHADLGFDSIAEILELRFKDRFK